MKKHKLGITTKTVLLIILFTGGLFVVSAMPNVVQVYPFAKRLINRNKKEINYKLKNKFNDLLKNGYIEKKGTKFKLTPKGEMVLMKINPNLIKKQKWDGKWRIVCFDVREDSRRKRDAFRFELKSLGFIQMQRSVWVSPYPCEKYIELLRAEHNFGKNIRYILADRISEDEKLRGYFGIKK